MTTLADLKKLAQAATPGPWKWQGEDYRGGWGWQLLVGKDGAGIICGESPDGAYKHLQAFVPIAAQYCKTGMLADAESAPCVHVLRPNAELIAAFSPERILAMIACIEAADAMWDYGCQPSEAYRIARAALEKE